MPMQIILSCFVSHTSSLVIFHLRIPGTNDTGCLPLRNSRKILILEFIISSVPCFTDREYLNFILIIFNINFYINTDYYNEVQFTYDNKVPYLLYFNLYQCELLDDEQHIVWWYEISLTGRQNKIYFEHGIS